MRVREGACKQGEAERAEPKAWARKVSGQAQAHLHRAAPPPLTGAFYAPLRAPTHPPQSTSHCPHPLGQWHTAGMCGWSLGSVGSCAGRGRGIHSLHGAECQQVRQQQPQSPRCTVHAYVLADDHANGQAKRPARRKFPPCACMRARAAHLRGPEAPVHGHHLRFITACVRVGGVLCWWRWRSAWSAVSSQPAWSARKPSRAPASIPACNSNCRLASVLHPHAHTHARMRSCACAHTRTRALAHTLHPALRVEQGHPSTLTAGCPCCIGRAPPCCTWARGWGTRR